MSDNKDMLKSAVEDSSAADFKDNEIIEESVSTNYNKIITVGIVIISFIILVLIVLLVKPNNLETKDDNNLTISDIEESISTDVQDVKMETGTEEIEYTTKVETEAVFQEDNISVIDYLHSDRSDWGPNVVGELYIPGTQVHDLVVQGEDNAYYLDKDIYNNESESGSLFLDYRNSSSILNRNNIIYGHNMMSGAMFGTLQKLLNDTFYEMDCSSYLYYNTKDYNYRLKVFSVYEIDLVTFNYIQTSFSNDTEFESFIDKIKELNMVDRLSDIDVNKDSRILTLSTCTKGGSHRLVVHCVMIDMKPVGV